MRLILFSFLLLFLSCSENQSVKEAAVQTVEKEAANAADETVHIDLEQIKKRGKLIALTNYSTKLFPLQGTTHGLRI